MTDPSADSDSTGRRIRLIWAMAILEVVFIAVIAISGFYEAKFTWAGEGFQWVGAITRGSVAGGDIQTGSPQPGFHLEKAGPLESTSRPEWLWIPEFYAAVDDTLSFRFILPIWILALVPLIIITRVTYRLYHPSPIQSRLTPVGRAIRRILAIEVGLLLVFLVSKGFLVESWCETERWSLSVRLYDGAVQTAFHLDQWGVNIPGYLIRVDPVGLIESESLYPEPRVGWMPSFQHTDQNIKCVIPIWLLALVPLAILAGIAVSARLQSRP